MCLNPGKLPSGDLIGCTKCWQCTELRIQDWVGRCIAESKTCAEAYSLTLTYGGGDHARAAVLTYSDVQKYFKRLRKAGYRFKYLVAGEFGGRKGRTHWHLMMFFQDRAPPHKIKTRYICPFWPHGWSWWEDVHSNSARYVCKYIQKDDRDDEAQRHFYMSKKPPIGHEYLMSLADKCVENGLSPKDLKYFFDENRDKKGKKVPHLMQGAIARDFIERFLSQWALTYPGRDWPTTATKTCFIADFLEKKEGESIRPHIHIPKLKTPTWLPRRGVQYYHDEANSTYYCHVDGLRYEWRNYQEGYSWRSVTGMAVDRREVTVYELDLYLQIAKLNRDRDQEQLRLAKLDPLRLENYVSGRMKLPKTVKRWSTQMVGELRRPLA